MINAIIFDFGDIFINLDKISLVKEFTDLGLKEWSSDLDEINKQFEIGNVSEQDFLDAFKKHIPHASYEQIRHAWNALLGEFPLYRLEFLQNLKGKFKLFLLSNTDSIHIDKFEHKVGLSFSRDFYNCFEKVYFSYELNMRKPNEAVFKHLINKHDLSPKRTLFIDDKKANTDAAAKLGINVWNLQVGEEDVVDLFTKKIITI
jgi:FMN phosphatase YigB (HAD superfamily)